MIPIITFIGWHNSGKTTLATQVVACLKARGYRVAVIKATKERGIVFDSAGTDTDRHRRAGAETVLLVAPDQLVMMSRESDKSLLELAESYCADVDLVIGEGFKGAEGVPKIEVRREADQPLLCRQVKGVVAVATGLVVPEELDLPLFGLDQGQEIADFIEDYFRLRKLRKSVTDGDATY